MSGAAVLRGGHRGRGGPGNVDKGGWNEAEGVERGGTVAEDHAGRRDEKLERRD